MKPHHYWQGSRSLSLSPNIQVQTVFAALKLSSTPYKGVLAKGLVAGGAKAFCAFDILPGLHGHRRSPPQIAHRRLREGYAAKDLYAFLLARPCALQMTGLGFLYRCLAHGHLCFWGCFLAAGDD